MPLSQNQLNSPCFLVHWSVFRCLSLVFALGNLAFGDPSIAVTNIGTNSEGHLQWRVVVAPDVSLFTQGQGSLAAEIGFEIAGSTFLDVSVDDAVWAFPMPGFNPFTDSITTGLSLAEEAVFVSLGSELVGDEVELLTITTAGSAATTLSWGGHAIQPGQPNSFVGGRLAQAGIKFDGIGGSLTAGSGALGDCNADGVADFGDLNCVCGLATIGSLLDVLGLLRGDLDGSGGVQFADFLTLSRNFGVSGVGYTSGDIDCSGAVDFADFLALSANFGRSSDRSSTAVPEPASSLLGPLIAMLAWLRRDRAWTRLG